MEALWLFGNNFNAFGHVIPIPELLEDNTIARGKTVIRKKTVSGEAKLRRVKATIFC